MKEGIEGAVEAMALAPQDGWALTVARAPEAVLDEAHRAAAALKKVIDSKKKKLTFNGKTQTAVEWAEELGANPFTIYSRLKRGWSHERALSTPFPNKQEEYA
jgi:hypothetical protein